VEPPRQTECVEDRSREGDAAQALGLVVEEPEVEAMVVSHQHGPLGERGKGPYRVRDRWSMGHHRVAGEPLDGPGNGLRGPHERGEAFDDGPVLDAGRADLDDRRGPRPATGRLYVHGDEATAGEWGWCEHPSSDDV